MKLTKKLNWFIAFVIVYELSILIFNTRYNNIYIQTIDSVILFVTLVLVANGVLHKKQRQKFILNNILILPLFFPIVLINDQLLNDVIRLLICYGLILKFYVPIFLRKFTAKNMLISIAGILMIVLTFGSLMMHIVEGLSYVDGLWWALITVTTIGYGDITPMTYLSKFLSVFVIFGGIMSISLLTAAMVKKASLNNDVNKHYVLNKFLINNLDNLSSSDLKSAKVIIDDEIEKRDNIH